MLHVVSRRERCCAKWSVFGAAGMQRTAFLLVLGLVMARTSAGSPGLAESSPPSLRDPGTLQYLLKQRLGTFGSSFGRQLFSEHESAGGHHQRKYYSQEDESGVAGGSYGPELVVGVDYPDKYDVVDPSEYGPARNHPDQSTLRDENQIRLPVNNEHRVQGSVYDAIRSIKPAFSAPAPPASTLAAAPPVAKTDKSPSSLDRDGFLSHSTHSPHPLSHSAHSSLHPSHSAHSSHHPSHSSHSSHSTGHSAAQHKEPEAAGSYPAAHHSSGYSHIMKGMGKYGSLLGPALLATGLLFLFPSVRTITGTASRRRRDLTEADQQEGYESAADPSGDLMTRLQLVYDTISDDEDCISRLFCELGAAIGETQYTRHIIKYIYWFHPEKSVNMKTLEKAAMASEPRCERVQCAAWDDSPPTD